VFFYGAEWKNNGPGLPQILPELGHRNIFENNHYLSYQPVGFLR